MIKDYFNKMKGTSKSPPGVSISEICWSWLGAFLGIAAVAYINFNKIDDTDLVDLMSDDVAPTQRADKVYADSRIDPDPDLTAESSVIAPSQKAALTKMKPYLTLPDKDYTYLVFDFLATAVGGAHYFKVFSLDVTRPEYAAFKDRFTKAPTCGWCMPWDLYDDGEGGLWPLTVVYDESQSSANEFVFVASRLDGGTIFGTIGNMAIYMKE